MKQRQAQALAKQELQIVEDVADKAAVCCLVMHA
jgi:hypothetical protein